MGSNFVGDEIHGECNNTQGGLLAFDLFFAGLTDVYTIEDNETVVITDLLISTVAGGLVGVVADGVAAGETACYFNAAAGAQYNLHLETPYECQPGIAPYVTAAADAFVTLQGYIIRN